MSLPVTAPRAAPRVAAVSARWSHPRTYLGRGRSLEFILVVSLSVAAVALALTHPWSHAYIGANQYGDAAYWDYAGENWARGYVGAKAPDIRPGYSLFLGIVYVLFGPSFPQAFFAQALLYGLGVAMAYGIAKRIAGALAGVTAAALLAFDPYMWEWTATSTTELLGAIANLAAVFFVVRSLRSRHAWIDAALFGACLAFANVVRPVTLPFIGSASLVLVFRGPGPLLNRVRLTVIAIAATGLILLPSVLYQYLATGDPGLSSNGAANLYAASAPEYGTWTPAIYGAVSAELTSRGITATPEAVNAEFTRLTIQNYLTHPSYQARRILEGLRNYGGFEGELERPTQYTFFRPLVAAGGLVLSVLLMFVAGRRQPAFAFAIPIAMIMMLVWKPVPVLQIVQAAALAAGLVIFVRSDRRVVALALVGLYWLTTGFTAIITTGIEGFFLNRLYTQAEPERAVLIAVALTTVATVAVRTRTRGAITALIPLERWSPRLPRTADRVPAALAVAIGCCALLGGVDLALANVTPPASIEYPRPNDADLVALATTLGLPGPPVYVDASTFDVVHATLLQSALPTAPQAYAVPGQFTRFLWYIDPQNRTLFWFVFSDRVRPPSLDRALLTGEAVGELTDAQFGNRPGLFILLPLGTYFDATGDPAQQNLLATRAFVPWNQESQRFEFERTIAFPLAVRLYDHARFDVAHKTGNIAEAGPLQLTDHPVRALELQGTATMPNDQAALTYTHLWIPANASFQALVAPDPKVFNRADVGPMHVVVSAMNQQGEQTRADRVLDPTDHAQWVYVPIELDLSRFAGQNVDLTIQVASATGAATQAPAVLVGEPIIAVH